MNRQNDNFYWGTRYEYAATLALSAITSAIQVPRPEDYGFDHICTLVEVVDKSRYPRMSFGVQVKPQGHEKLVYGDVNKKNEQQDWEIEWLFNRDLPFLISTVALEPSFCLRLYSTWTVWHAYWMKPECYKRKVNILINQRPELPNNGYDRWKSYPHDPASYDTYDTCDIYLGHPIIEMTSPTPDFDKAKLLYECLSFWIDLDRLNILYRKLGIPWMYTVQEWVTNEKPNFSPFRFTFQPKVLDMKENLIRTLAPMIWSLENIFYEQRDTENKNRLNGINEIIEEYGYKLNVKS